MRFFMVFVFRAPSASVTTVCHNNPHAFSAFMLRYVSFQLRLQQLIEAV